MKKLINKDLNLLILFVAIWEERNLSKVATRLFLSQPAISHALGRLRLQFDDQLFVRSSKGVIPTEYASILAKDIILAVSQLEVLYKGKEKFNPKDCKETLHLSIGDYFSSIILKDFIHFMEKNAPMVRIICHPDSEVFSLSDFEKGNIHLEVTGFQRKFGEGFHSIELLEDSITCCYRKGHPLLKKEKLSLKRYLECEHLFVSSIGNIGGLVDKRLNELKRERHVKLVVPGFFEVGELLAKNDFLLSGPNGLCGYLAKKHRLEMMPLPFEMGPFSIAMSWHERTQSDQFHSWIRDVITKLFVSVLK